MFHIKSNFVKGGPITQVPASWFNQVAEFLNNFVAGYGLKLKKNTSGASVISLDDKVLTPVSKDVGDAPLDKTDTETDDNNRTETWEWKVGGENGLKVDAYCLIQKVSGRPYASRCRLTISKDGIITKVEGLDGQRAL